jgi:predicted nuclease of restriction endonuclease-like (RecB) superfamily
LDKVKNPIEREWYIHQTLQQGWSRNILVHQIESGLFHRQGKAITNFDRTLPKPQSELAEQLLKEPYCFDFLSLEEKATESDLEKALINHFKDFLLELGVGFAVCSRRFIASIVCSRRFITSRKQPVLQTNVWQNDTRLPVISNV